MPENANVTVVSAVPGLVLYLMPTAISLVALAVIAETARRLRLPVVTTTVLVGTAALTAWHWLWSTGGNDAVYFYDLVPTKLGDLIAGAAQEIFHPNHHRAPPGGWVDLRPWPLRPPQVGMFVTVVFWGALSALTATLVRRRRTRT